MNIVLCGIMELARLSGRDSKFLQSTRPMLLRLCYEDFLDVSADGRVILKSACGNRVAYSSWGNYFLMEALARELGVLTVGGKRLASILFPHRISK